MKKITLIILTAIFLLTGCTKENNDSNYSKEKVYYAFGYYNTIEELVADSKDNYQDIMSENTTKMFVKLEKEQLSLCVFEEDKLECFKNNNYDEEKKHFEKIYSEDYCSSLDNSYYCSNVYQYIIDSTGYVGVSGSWTSCSLYPDNKVECISAW